MRTVLITGYKGFKDAIWKKLNHAPFGCQIRGNTRPMHDWECAVVSYSPEDQEGISVEYSTIKDVIGTRLMKKYSIHLD